MNELIELIAAETGHAVEGITPETPIENLVDDSLEFVSLMSAIKHKFGEFPDAWMGRIERVKDLFAITEAVKQ
jgi:acyl carrier protein